MAKSVLDVRQSNPTGKSLLIFRNGVKPGNQKYSCCRVGQITDLTSPVYRDKRGDRDRHDRAVGCDGREVTTDERGLCVRRSREGPTPRCWRQVGGSESLSRRWWQQSRSPGRPRISCKAIAQGRPDASAKPVCSCAASCCNYRTRDRGCGAHPVFP